MQTRLHLVDRDAIGDRAAVGEEVKKALRAAGFTVSAAAALAGLNYRTTARYISGERDMPMSVLLALMSAANADLVDLATRLQNRTHQHPLESSTPQAPSEVFLQLDGSELSRRLALIFSARGLSAADSYEDIAGILALSDLSISLQNWERLMTSELPVAPHADILYALARALDVNPDYLISDDLLLRADVEARLQLDSKMRFLGVERVATRSLNRIQPDELNGVAQIVTAIVTELRKH